MAAVVAVSSQQLSMTKVICINKKSAIGDFVGYRNSTELSAAALIVEPRSSAGLVVAS